MIATPAGRRTQAQRRAAAEECLIEAAIDLINDGGTPAVTLAGVGARAGYSRGIVNHHFGHRVRLLEVVAQRLQDAFGPPDADGRVGRAWVLAICDAYLVHTHTNPRLARAFLALWAQALTSERQLQPVFKARDDHFRRFVAGALREGLRDGSVRADADPQALAVTIVGMLRGITLQTLLSSPRTNLNRIRHSVSDVLERGLST